VIEVKHSSIVIHNYTIGDCPKLEKILSVWDKAIYGYSWQNFIYDEDQEQLIVPRGFDVKYLQWLFKDKKLFVNQKADDSKIAIFQTKVDPRDEEQEKAIDFLLGDGEFKDTADLSQRMLCLKTGGGKTYCTINALSHFRKRVMVIVDKDKIMQQWKNEFIKFTNLNEKEVYLISGSSTMEKIMNSRSDLPYKVYIASHRTLSSYAGDDWTRVTDFFNKIKIGVKVYDEAHVEYRNIFMLDSFTNTANNIYLTATPGRSNPLEDAVYQNCFKEVPKHGLAEKFEDPYHYLYYISYNSNPPADVIAKCQSQRGFDTNVYSDYVFEKRYDDFVEMITKILDLVINKGGKTAIILHKNDHIKKLAKTLSHVYPNVSIGTFSTIVKDKEQREKELDKQLIISTEKSLGKAVDVKGLQFLIMTVPTSSKIVAEQTLGRLRQIKGKKSFYFDLTDIGFKSCVNQRRLRRQILDQKAIKIKLLNM
jgi:superfamily II DNA or RNA helicase